jgi:serine/threonine-protein kinase
MLDLPAGPQLSPVGGRWPASPAMAISPDGRTIVYAGAPGGDFDPDAEWRLYRRRLDEAAATPMQGTDGGYAPFFAPDGQWVGFFSFLDGALKKVPVDGGPAVTITRVTPFRAVVAGVSWGADDTIAYSLGPADGIFRVSADGGEPERVTSLDAVKEWRHTLPHLLPGGRALLYTAGVADGDTLGTRVMAHRFDTGDTQLLLDNAADARFVASGHLLFMRRGTLMAAPFDVERVAFTGPAIAVVDGIVQSVGASNSNAETYRGQFELAANGTMVYLSGGTLPPLRSELVWLDRNGTEAVVPNTPTGWHVHLRLAPDGRQVVIDVRVGDLFANGDLWVYDLARGTARRLTYGGAPGTPVWSPDSSHLVYSRYFVDGLFRTRADGSTGPGEPFATLPLKVSAATWSKADDTLLSLERNAPRAWGLSMNGVADAKPVKERPPFLAYLQFSPDGRWLAYVSAETGDREVYVEPYPGPGAAVRISPDGGHSPSWAGNELFYLRGANDRTQMMAVVVDTRDGFNASAPRVLFDAPAAMTQTVPTRSYDVTPDGQRFITSRITSTPPEAITRMHVVLNWFEELERRVPVN